MMVGSPARVGIGMPIFNGGAWLPETLARVRAQTYPHIDIHVSIDGGDTDSEAALQAVAGDPRFTMTRQPRNLGWRANLNWLMRHATRDHFIYMQQDDLIAPTYVEELVRAAGPGIAVSCCDVRHGIGTGRVHEARPIDGTRFERVLASIAPPGWVAFRGLVSAQAVQQAGHLDESPRGEFSEDFAWHVRMAHVGAIRRVPKVLYEKRRHAGSVSAKWHSDSLSRRAVHLQRLSTQIVRAAMPTATTRAEREALMIRAVRHYLVGRPHKKVVFPIRALRRQDRDSFMAAWMDSFEPTERQALFGSDSDHLLGIARAMVVDLRLSLFERCLWFARSSSAGGHAREAVAALHETAAQH
jgi:GT2 family glycosyltransferase